MSSQHECLFFYRNLTVSFFYRLRHGHTETNVLLVGLGSFGTQVKKNWAELLLYVLLNSPYLKFWGLQ